MSAESFLDRYSLPRIARLIAPKAFYDDQLRQPNSNSILGKSKKLSTVNHYLHQHPINSNQQPSNDTNCSDDIKADNNNNGELFLLYRHLKKYKVYHAVNAKSGTNRKKGIKIPQDFTGECRSTHFVRRVIAYQHTMKPRSVRNVTLISWLRNSKQLQQPRGRRRKTCLPLSILLLGLWLLIETVNKFIFIDAYIQ